jgi:uncharacterized protein YlxW (UPF0749 family)
MGPPGLRRPGRWLLVAAGVAAATLVIAVAAVQAHRHAPAAARSRDALVHQVEDRTAAVTDLQRNLTQLRVTSTRLRDEVLQTTNAGALLARQLSTEELVAGTVAVQGPGLRVVLGDAPTRAGAGNRVLDRDLQAVVNALWAAGAEAIAVGDQRLTAQSAIRQAGSAVLVNFEPVSAPYVVSAVGNPVALETSFGASKAAARMRSNAQLYGLRFSYSRAGSLRLPPAPGLTLTHAKPSSRSARAAP